MKRGSFLLQLDFDDLFRVVPGAAGIGHEDRLEQTEERDRHQIADEVVRLDEGEGERRKKYRQEDVEHSLLCVFGADLDYLLAVGD